MTSHEFSSFEQDDTVSRIEARVRLIEKIVYPVAKWIIDACPTLQWDASSSLALLNEYKKLRNEAQKLMRGYRDPGHLLMIDRHKIAAAFIMAIVKARPLKPRAGSKPKMEIALLANEILAFQAGVRILGAFAYNDASMQQVAKKDWPIEYPTPKAKGEYKHHAYRALRHGMQEQKLNLPILAHWMFYIEKYWQLACPLVVSTATNSNSTTDGTATD